VLISYQLLPTAAEKHAIYKNSVYGVIVCLAIFNLLWLMGSEGSASLGLSQEVGIYVIVDVVLKTGLGLYIVLQYGAFRNQSIPSPLLPSPLVFPGAWHSSDPYFCSLLVPADAVMEGEGEEVNSQQYV
jgi:hypothetical protein